MALSLNFITGLADQFSLGHAGLMAIGAYTSAILNKEFLNNNWAFIPVGVLAGALVAAAAGYLISLPSFKLKGDYLAIVTLGMAEIVRVVLLNWNHVGGPRGYNAITKFPEFIYAYSFAVLLLSITFVTMYRLKFSWFGRNLWAINEDEIAAEVMGLDVAKTKRRAFVISSFFAGLGGGFYSHHLGYISPGSFGFIISVQILIVAVLGGLGSLSGSILAALILTFLPELLRSLPTGSIDIRMIVYPILLILMMILRPSGLFGRREINISNLFLYLKSKASR
jgi:branched-chain amino acid transport system permease protein